MEAVALPDDGYKIPDIAEGTEKYRDWSLNWSGWHQMWGASSYVTAKHAFWAAYRDGEKLSPVAAVRTPVVWVEEGGVVPGNGISSFEFASGDASAIANTAKAEARAALLAELDRADGVITAN